MASFSVVCNNSIWTNIRTFSVLPTSSNPRGWCIASHSQESSTSALSARCCVRTERHCCRRFFSSHRFGVRLTPEDRSCYTRINSALINGGDASRADEHACLGKRGRGSSRSRLSLRLRPRLRLLRNKLKQTSFRAILNVLRMYVKTNVTRVALFASIAAALGFFCLFMRFTTFPSPKVVPYSEFISTLQDNRVTKVLLEEGSRRIYYSIKSEESATTQPLDELVNDGVPNVNADEGITRDVKNVWKTWDTAPQWQFSTRKVDHDEKFLLGLMRAMGTSYCSAPQSILMSLRSTLITILSLWIPLTPLMWLLYRQLATANSPAKKRKPTSLMVTFDDVEGVDAAKLELMEVVSCLQDAINYQKVGAKLPRGVLLFGPPGTGKTLLARAVAGEAGVPFFSVSASEFVELFVGRGAARIRDLFKVARKCSPSIIFIDELDAVGGKRGRSFNDERDQTLNQLLTEMDGFESEMKVVVIAASNRPEALDPALCRPGRFSRKILVGEPDQEGRKKILAVHFRDVPLEEDPNLICDLVATLTAGFVGADLANIVNESALLAGRRDGDKVSREDIMQAIERARYGIVERKLSPAAFKRELGKLIPWMPSWNGQNRGEPLGYQTLS